MKNMACRGLFILVMALSLLQLSCGKEEPTASKKVGTTGPTNNGYYFDLQADPSVVKAGGSVTFTVHVWDSYGNDVEGLTVYFSGASASGATAETNRQGLAVAQLTIGEGVGGNVEYITVTVDGKSLDIPIQIKPDTQVAA